MISAYPFRIPFMSFMVNSLGWQADWIRSQIQEQVLFFDLFLTPRRFTIEQIVEWCSAQS